MVVSQCLALSRFSFLFVKQQQQAVHEQEVKEEDEDGHGDEETEKKGSMRKKRKNFYSKSLLRWTFDSGCQAFHVLQTVK